MNPLVKILVVFCVFHVLAEIREECGVESGSFCNNAESELIDLEQRPWLIVPDDPIFDPKAETVTSTPFIHDSQREKILSHEVVHPAINENATSKSKVKIAKGANEKGLPPTVNTAACEDRYPQCVSYAQNGECQKNPGWMIINCPSTCNSCHLRDPKVRCTREFLNISTSPIFQPGELHAMFENIVPEFGDQYQIEVLSTSPWIVTFENFLTPEECGAFIETVSGGWERSTDTGAANEFGEAGRILSQSRTSSNAWCRHHCESNPHVQNVIRKIEQVTRTPFDHSESFQILQYENGQFYKTHHDMSPRQAQLSCGPRILTFFLYLSDVEEGGETDFPYINLRVKPKRGKAVLWPSVLDSDLEKQDPRTHHQALPVIKGVKYASNSWIHLYDFRQSNLWGCTGTFDYL